MLGTTDVKILQENHMVKTFFPMQMKVLNYVNIGHVLFKERTGIPVTNGFKTCYFSSCPTCIVSLLMICTVI